MSNEKCTMGRVLFRIQYHYHNKKYVTFTFDIWPWLFSLTLTLIFDLEIDLLLHWCFEEIIAKKINVWCHVTQKWYIVRYIGYDTSDRYFFMEHFATNQKFYDFRFQIYSPKGDFHGFWSISPWPSHFKVIRFLRILHLFPFMTGVNFEAICSLIAEI